MRGLGGNPHFQHENMRNTHSSAGLIEATLALTYEQRTANLLALWANPHAAGMNGMVTWGIDDHRIGELLQEIQQRLGVDK